MKAITLTQPWATLVATGQKNIETRSWQTHYRGRLAIHAAKGFPGGARDMCKEPWFAKSLAKAGITDSRDLPLGVVIATCKLIDVIKIEASTKMPEFPELAFGFYDPGRFMWMLKDIKILPSPVPASGLQRLWEWDEFAR